MTAQERAELAALNAYWPRCTDPMPQDIYRRWCDLQIKERDAARASMSHGEKQ
jgi:hypothetical protein